MTTGDTNSLRFKSGSVEFELTGSGEQIDKAWDALQEAVANAFLGSTAGRAPNGDPDPDEGQLGTKRPRKKSSRKGSSSSAKQPSGERERVLKTLLEAELDDLPDVVDAKARWQGYALLQWAKEKHGIDGLTVNEIQAFYQDRFAVPNTPGAYREAFRAKGREVVKSGTPAVFRLMKDGNAALESYLAKVEAGATHEDAAAAADKEGAEG